MSKIASLELSGAWRWYMFGSAAWMQEVHSHHHKPNQTEPVNSEMYFRYTFPECLWRVFMLTKSTVWKLRNQLVGSFAPRPLVHSTLIIIFGDKLSEDGSVYWRLNNSWWTSWDVAHFISPLTRIPEKHFWPAQLIPYKFSFTFTDE